MATVAVGNAAAIPFGYDHLPFDHDDVHDPPSDLLLFASLSDSMYDSPNFPVDIPMPLAPEHALDSPQEHLGTPSSRPSSLNTGTASSNPTTSSSDRAPQRLDTCGLGRNLVLQTAGSNSPGTTSTSIILTPASTLLEYNSSGSDSADARDSWSPVSAGNDRFGVHADVLRPVYDVTVGNAEPLSAFNGSQPFRPPPIPSSEAEPSTFPSVTASIASSSALTSTFSPRAWNSFDNPIDEWMDPSPHRHGDDPDIPHPYPYNFHIFPGVTREPDINLPRTDGFAQHVGETLSFTGHEDTSGVLQQSPYIHGTQSYQQPFIGFPGLQQNPTPIWSSYPNQIQMQQDGMDQQAHYNISLYQGPAYQHPIAPDTLQARTSATTVGAVPKHAADSSLSQPAQTVSMNQASTYAQVNQQTAAADTPAVKQYQQVSVRGSPSSAAGSRPSRSNAKQKAPVGPSGSRGRVSDTKPLKPGGRPKGQPLTEKTRQKSNQMRKTTACWLCAMQRDSCDHGEPCNRCLMRAKKGQTYFFDCNRDKLPAFMHDFVPNSMTWMHQKQTIEDTVSLQVHSWDRANPIEIELTSGYGPPLRWQLYEFQPKSDEYLKQLQYFQDPNTGQSCRYHKYSPPFALMKLDANDDSHFSEYLDQLLEPEHLWEFGWTFYEEETQVDPDGFQAQTLQFLCDLFTSTKDDNVRSVLNQILRMMLVTFIMGHTLTIEDSMLDFVLASVKGTPTPRERSRHTSPRLANRQFKFFFNVLRTSIYERLLHWLQQTLHTSGKREVSWLPAFCAILGFAMTLEELQRLIMVQTDSEIFRNPESAEETTIKTRLACERIDDRFKLLVGLFQCKYRDRAWGENGSFGAGTPQLRDPTAHTELQNLRDLVVEKVAHLESRSKVEYAQKNQCQYTSRLVARFLLPFLKLPS